MRPLGLLAPVGQFSQRALDVALDRSVVLGYTSIGPRVRRTLWPADPTPGCLQGKRVVVTGATSGIGEAIARQLLELGATVHLLGRNAQKVADYARDLREQVANSEVVEEVCDVSDLDAVRAWAGDLSGRIEVLHGLVHNAGTMTTRREESAQGHELGLAAHVLGPHLMTRILRDRLLAAPGTVVWMSSGGMYGARLHADDADDIEYRRGQYDGVQAYARTKRMQVVMAQVWADALLGTGVQSVSMHPGWVRTPGVSEHLPTFDKVVGPLLREPDDGADTAVWLVAKRPPSHPPYFWHDRAQRPTTFGWQRAEDVTGRDRLRDYVAAATDAP
ncbi:SDR family NAD(P)-dependent oxidoreductase [Nocardioides acrostichi]|uniref:SDR family NAD(P)-dependent oxidoreductase n=1 Tax=Nocardioides acrostichi TaxID=2784339 RepID=A0A930V4G7_9ACTN|nr:SDR family NAD(P)-dependent oxidoreductase [Nocardioides acrostichi]MBF4163667.1 SDR family NAD(P)-dependent oxidoreductase [Nocardioides acrostichi]